MVFRHVFVLAALVGGLLSAQGELAFEKGDRVGLIGNGLPDFMQHNGWLETYLQSANQGKELVIRDMGFCGDQVVFRPREQAFPTTETMLEHMKADWVFAFYGYNESYDQDPDKFKDQLEGFIESTLSAKYNGESTPKLVLFSPIAFEDLGSRDFPDGKEQNRWLSIYTDAMARVAADNGVLFVDLFAPTKALYAERDEPMTINGVHLNHAGDQAVSRIIVEALGQKIDETHAEKIRAAVLDKNWCWFNRYRATDGNDVWGSRSVLTFKSPQTNAEVLQHELVMLDVMSENRDKVIWSAAQGKDAKPDDSNVPPPVPVETSLSIAGGDGSKDYIPAKDGVGTLKLAKGMVANLFASEEEFPELVNPVQMDVDTKGRIWVAAWQTYPKWQPNLPMNDRLLILPDDNHDGVADKAITFAYVHNPTGFTFWNGGVLVASVPNLWFLKDTDGDDVADFKQILFGGLDSADTHHSPNGFDYGPDGYVYYQRGVFNVSNVETPWGPAVHSGTSGMYRYNPRTHRFSFHAQNDPNAHGGDFDYWGYHFATDATGGRAFQVRMDEGGKFKMHELLKKTVRPVPSSGVLSSLHFPPENEGNYLILNAIGFLGIKQYTLENKDGEIWGTETDDFLVSTDPNFRPTDFKVGDDGAVYIADWQNAIIGHMQHNIRDPERDHAHGRVYRVTYEGRPLQERTVIDGQPIPALLDVLKHPVNGVRQRARVELSEHNSDEVIAAVGEWIQQFDAGKAEDAHHLLEALWLHQQHNVVNEGLLAMLLNSPDPDAKRAAERVKYLWEIEGQIGGTDMHAHMDHMNHDAGGGGGEDYLKQEPSPEPKLEGDTMVVHIQTLKEQMKYDRKAFAVKPGMKVKVVFSNPDAMDHNMMFVQPGSESNVAMAAMMLGPEGPKKMWRPESDKIIAASKIVMVGETDTIEFTAPNEVGTVPYICTYPGHFMLMNGTMHIVDDIDKWNAENKDTAVQKPGSGGPTHEWTVAELANDLDKIKKKSRKLKRGEEIFTAASCNICHLPAKGGRRIGPDLGGVADRLLPLAMLTEMIEPSKVINENFKSWQVTVDTGDALSDDTVFGIIVEETDEHIVLLTNPLQDTEGTKVLRSQIKEIVPAPLSTMPTGLLNNYSREDILDLFAYITSLKPADDTKPAAKAHAH